MTISVENETDFKPDFDFEQIAADVINGVLDYFECPYESEVNILITDDNTIREINKEQRNIDLSTDVLSFPMNEYEIPGDFKKIEEEESPDSFNYETGELLLGDIVLSAEHILKQAEEYGHTVKREYAFLITHSMLHLLGFDHMEPEDAEIMEKHQKDILNGMGITR